MSRSLVASIVLLSAALCGADAPTKTGKTSEFQELPVLMTVKQRSTTTVPGAKDGLVLTIDDITGGQVIVSMARKENEVVLPPTSLRAGETKTFKFGKREYQLQVKMLRNLLIGDDTGEFEIALPPDPKSEPAKIEQLLAKLTALDGAVFIRNETEYSITETTAHLRAKWQAAKDEVTTAEQFIEHIASKSSVNGKPYVIRLADKTVVPAGVYLRARLREIEKKS